MRRQRPSSTIVVSVIVLVAACGDSTTRAGGVWTGTVDTLESGRVVVHNPDVPLWAAGEEWQLRERLRIGRAEGEGPDLFGEIRDIEVGPDGDLYVLDAQASEVRVFGGDGTHLRTFGRAGQGPGELSRPIGMAFDPEGTLWVHNWGNARYTAFDPATGEVLREPRRLAGFGMIPWPGAIGRNGRMIDVGLDTSGQPAILGLDTAFVPVDTLAMPVAEDRHRIFFRRANQVVMSMMEPFAPQPSWAPHPEGGIIVGDGATYRIHRVHLDGDTTMTIEVERPPVPITSEERDSALAAFQDAVQYADGGVPDRQPNVADVKPAHARVFVDDEARIWVGRTTARGEDPAWDVFDRDGRLLGAVTIPVPGSYVTPAVRGETFAVATSIDDVPAIVVYDIVRSPVDRR